MFGASSFGKGFLADGSRSHYGRHLEIPLTRPIDRRGIRHGVTVGPEDVPVAGSSRALRSASR